METFGITGVTLCLQDQWLEISGVPLAVVCTVLACNISEDLRLNPCHSFKEKAHREDIEAPCVSTASPFPLRGPSSLFFQASLSTQVKVMESHSQAQH